MVADTAPDLLQLPFEIVSDIFTQSVTPRPFFTLNISKLPPNLPNRLPHRVSHGASQVCRRWRDIALSTPYMWTDIPIYRTADRLWKGEKYIVGELDLYLTRSGALSIHIYLDIPRLHHYHDHTISLQIFHSLMRESHRWGTAVIFIPSQFEKYLPSQIPPKLQKLHCRIRMSRPNYKLLLDSHPSALKELIVDDYYRFSGFNEAELEGGVGAALETFIGVPKRLADLKQAALTLKKCVFRGVHLYDMDIPQASHGQITFPALESFEIHGLNFREPTPFRHIDALKLRSVVVNSFNTVHLLSDMRQAAISSSWKLTDLALGLEKMTWYSLLELLNLLPTLNRLDISDPPLSSRSSSLKTSDS